jgi:hypothetical protein
MIRLNKRIVLIPIGIVILFFILNVDCSSTYESPYNAINALFKAVSCSYKPMYYGGVLLGIIILFMGVFSLFKNGFYQNNN